MAGKIERRPIAGEPVSVPFLAQEFGLSAPTVKIRLAAIRAADTGNRGEPLYRISEAAPLLIQRQRVQEADIAKAMKNLRPQDLPPMTQAVYWDAMRKRQAWERDAGMLWRTDDVLDVLTDVFRAIRESIRLWADEVDGEKRLSSENLKYLRSRTNDLQATLHDKLVALKDNKETRSSAAYVDDPMLTASVAEVISDEPEEDDVPPSPPKRRRVI